MNLNAGYDCAIYRAYNDIEKSNTIQPFLFPLSADVNMVVGTTFGMGLNYAYSRNCAAFMNLVNPAGSSHEDYSGKIVFSSSKYALYTELYGKHGFSVANTYLRLGLFYSTITNIKYFDVEKRIDTGNYFVFTKSEIPENFEQLELKQKFSNSGIYYAFGKRFPVTDRMLLSFGVSGHILPLGIINDVVFTHDTYNGITNKNVVDKIGTRRIAINDFAKFECSLVYFLF